MRQTPPTTAEIANPFTDPIGRWVWALIFTGLIKGSTTTRVPLTLGQRAEITRAVYGELQAAGVQIYSTQALPATPQDQP